MGPESKQEKEAFLALGRVGRPFGVRGEIRVHPYNPDTEVFPQLAGLWIEDEAAGRRYFRLLRSRRHNKEIRLTLEGIKTREEAEALRGKEVLVEKAALPQLGEDEYYWYQLVGLEVWSREGQRVGTVVRIEVTAPQLDGNDVLVVEADQGEILIPAVDLAIAEIDLKRGRITLTDWFAHRR